MNGNGLCPFIGRYEPDSLAPQYKEFEPRQCLKDRCEMWRESEPVYRDLYASGADYNEAKKNGKLPPPTFYCGLTR